MYNPDLQYRCTIIRGKAQTELDNLLPTYCQIINRICPQNSANFAEAFNKMLSNRIHIFRKKTLDNHRTEIAGKLFGLWYLMDGIVYCSKQAIQYLDHQDNPLLFKNIIIKFQFPNGMDKIQTIRERMSNHIRFRPAPFILGALQYAENIKNANLSKREIGYYILNNLDVLQGKVHYSEVVERIFRDREDGVFHRVEVPNKAISYTTQHITELLNLFELANLVRISKAIRTEKFVSLNNSETVLISQIINLYSSGIEIDPYTYDMNSRTGISSFFADWDRYYSSPVEGDFSLNTKISGLLDDDTDSIMIDNLYKIDKSVLGSQDALAIGDEGEKVAMEYEKQRVKQFSSRLTNKVIYFGKQRGLGYDISSIFAGGANPEHAIYIEVKTTKRVTAPPQIFSDQFNMTRNEWIAAEQHSNNYFVYRVYLYNNGVKIYKMESPFKLRESGSIFAEPMSYHIEFDQGAGNFIHEN